MDELTVKIAPATAQWFINMIMAMQTGHDPSVQDMQNVGSILCSMVQAEAGRSTFKVGDVTIVCNQKGPDLVTP